MFEIVRKEFLTPAICLMEVKAPRVAASAQPGQFVIVRSSEDAERIPLTICDYDREHGTITIVIQIIGASSKKICDLEQGGMMHDFVGPLGEASEFVHEDVETLKKKRYLFIAGGLGIAPVYPQVKYLHSKGVACDVIMGAKTADLLIMEKEMAEQCDNLYVCTDDGSKGFKGLVTKKLKELVESGNKYDQAVAIGPMIMMKFVKIAAEEFKLPLIVSLNTLMVDGTGMCGACRVTVDGKTKFACVDGPEFDAYKVDFDEALRRQAMYKSKEVASMEKLKSGK